MLRLSNDRGFAMIEAIVASMLLVVVSLGVLRGLDTAQRSSGREKARSTAAALTERDQEQLRSMRAVDLANYDYTRTVEVNKVKYEITSQVDWVRDSTGGTESCNNNSSQADYMRITSTTKSSLINTPIPPIKMSSIVAPPVGAFGANQGTLGVQVNDRNGAGVPGMPVTITGPTTISNPTNSAGCAIFAYVPTGSYTARVNSIGWVDPGGNQDASVGATVNNDEVTVAQLTYDRASSVAVTFDTEARDGTKPAVSATQLSASNSGVPAGPNSSSAGVRTWDPAGGAATAITGTDMFPFVDGYGLFAGGCAAADPSLYDPDYYQLPEHTDEFVHTTPGAAATPAVVRVPSINLKVVYGGVNNPMPLVNNATVRIVVTSKSTDCDEKFIFAAPAVDDAGWMLAPALPFGDYQVCADAISPATGTRRRKTLGAGTALNPWIKNYSPQGIKPPANPVIDFSPNTSTQSGSCP
jgi:Tfp pilus assembly protein PilV